MFNVGRSMFDVTRIVSLHFPEQGQFTGPSRLFNAEGFQNADEGVNLFFAARDFDDVVRFAVIDDSAAK